MADRAMGGAQEWNTDHSAGRHSSPAQYDLPRLERWDALVNGPGTLLSPEGAIP